MQPRRAHPSRKWVVETMLIRRRIDGRRVESTSHRRRSVHPFLTRLVLAALTVCGAAAGDVKLPEGFLIGAGTSAFQVEGAWNTSGKGEGLFDNVLHASDMLQIPNVDVASDSYHRFKDDVAAARELKVYRFSISWPRLFPDGRTLNEDGLRYYNALLDELEASRIEPMVTLFHFDLPQALIDEFGAWSSDKMIDAFVFFADFAFSHFGNRVRYWTTHNEPYLYCVYAPYFGPFLSGTLKTGETRPPPPGHEADDYQCLHRIILSHGRVYRMFKEKYVTSQGGLVGLSNFSFAPRPNSTSYADIAAARRYNLLTLGTAFSPFVTGDYPIEVRRMVDEASALEGFNKSRLPYFTPEESAMLRGSIDFLGVNNYVGLNVAAGKRPELGNLMTDAAAFVVNMDKISDSGLSYDAQMTPWSLSESVLWLWNEYRVPIFVTENGYLSENNADSLHDERRAVYHSAYLRELLRSMEEGGVRVLGYIAWSLIDLYELSRHYRYSYGLVKVDFNGGSYNRTLKQSSSFFKKLGETRTVPEETYNSAACPVLSQSLGHAVAASLLITIWRNFV